jgi:hypothetical protein
MGTSTHILGIKPPDEDFKKMFKAYKACIDAEVDVPKEVLEFFNYIDPDPSGIVVDLPADCKKPYNTDNEQGFEINIKDLPKDIKIIRFYNSW